MADALTPERRSQNMSRIEGSNTKPEMLVRRALHARGLRFRLHSAALAGRPDIVLPKWNVVIFVHGCFWHGHNCSAGRTPKTRPEFWKAKLLENRNRDIRTIAEIRSRGWRVLTIWECALRGSRARQQAALEDAYRFIIGTSDVGAEIPKT